MKLLVQIREIPTPEQIEKVRATLNRSPHTTLRFAFSQPNTVKPVSDGAKGSRAELTVDVGGYWPSDAALTTKPPSLTKDATALLGFSSTEVGSSFECQVDSGTFASCISPKTVSGLADGEHTFKVRAIDFAGNKDTTPASYAWKVDLKSPTFGGLTSAVAPGSTSVLLSWAEAEATDTVSAGSAIVYNICRSTSSSTCQIVFTSTYTTSPGATNYLVQELTTNTTYYFVVRAQDEAGNVDSNSVQKLVALTSISCGPSNCLSGCCSAGACQAGTSATACGTGGNACAVCSTNFTCSTSQTCALSSTSLWKLEACSMAVSLTDSCGNYWDFATDSDLMIQVVFPPTTIPSPSPSCSGDESSTAAACANDGTRACITPDLISSLNNKTSYTFSPPEWIWLNVAASKYMAGIRIGIWDMDDGVGHSPSTNDDLIGSTSYTPSESDFQKGVAGQCFSVPAFSRVSSLSFRLTPQ